MKGWRTALRVARREARRAKGRAALVVAMIALPVAALSFFAVTYDTFELSPDEEADRLMGTAQAKVTWAYDGPVHQFPTQLIVIPTGAVTRSDAPAAQPDEAKLLALLPPGTTAIPDVAGRLTVRTATGIGTLNARMLDYTAPLAHGIFRPRSGQPPANADEVALTPAAARRLGVGVGGTVRLSEGSRTFRVTAIAEDPNDLTATTIVLRPGALPAADLSATGPDLTWLVATPLPLTWAQVKQLNTYGVAAVSRHVLAHPPSQADRYPEFGGNDEVPLAVVGLVGGLAMLEVVLLAGPAFAVGARRRRRDLALVAASGGTPAQLRRIVLADGVVLGVIAAVTGVVFGVAVAVAIRPMIESLSEVRSGGLRVFPLALAGLAGLAVTTGVLAALVPAWISARQDVVTALAGRRGVTRSRRRWIVLGVVLGAAGVGVAAVGAWRVNSVVILAGLALAELGLVLCTPAIVGLVARLGRWLPLAPRIALRDASRNRTAAAPAISAVMAAVIGSLAIGVVLVANERRSAASHRTFNQVGDVFVSHADRGPKTHGPLPKDALVSLRDVLPVGQFHEIGMASCGAVTCFVAPRRPAARECPYSRDVLDREPTRAEQRAARRDSRCDGVGQMYSYFSSIGTPNGLAIVIDPAAVGAVAHLDPETADRAAAALRSGAVVVNDPDYLDGGRLALILNKITSSGERGERETVTAPGFAVPRRDQAPIAMMTEETASSLGLSSSPLVAFATTTRLPTVEEEDRAQAALGNVFWVWVERGPSRHPNILIVLAIVAGIITLGAAAIATGLAAADSRADLGTLAAIGAAPRVRRALSLSQSGVIAGLGSLLGAVAGLGASVAVLVALNRQYAALWPEPTPYPISVPWLNVGIAVLVVPLVAMLGAGLFTRSRLPIERRL